MEQFPITSVTNAQYPPLLREIPNPPQELQYRGQLPPHELSLLAVVGSRAYTSYGKQVAEYLIEGLASYNVGIVSGLALGIDTIAHEAALKHRLYTLAIPGSSLEPSYVYPARNRSLAERILLHGGGLLTEFKPATHAATWTFPQRNRLMAGIAQGTLLIEAGAKSGTLITARLAVDFNRELFAVPGTIFSSSTYGTHQFLKLGATLVTEPSDIIEVLHLNRSSTAPIEKKDGLPLDPDEALVVELLHIPQTRDALLAQIPLPTPAANSLIMKLELKGSIHYETPYYYRRPS